jgi:hypothetical protein
VTRERIAMIASVHLLLEHQEDQILLIDFGPVDGRAATCINAIGHRYLAPDRSVVVI